VGANGNQFDLDEAFIRAAVEEAKEQGTTPVALLLLIIRGKFRSEGSSGRVLVSTNDAGGTSSFQLAPGMGPADVMAMANRAIRWLESQPDPSNPSFAARRQTNRLRFQIGGLPL
jgi:hypothetical protein